MKMGNTSTYNREYYLKNRERINENAKRRRANMTAEQREKYLNRQKECYRKHHGYYVSRKQLLEENKKLKEELGEYKKMFEDQLKEVYIKNTAEFMDKKFPAINGFMEEDTLQELRDLGKI